MKVLKFYTKTCSQCQLVTPMLEGKAAEGEFELVNVDAEEQPELAGQYGIMGVPTIVVIDGEEVKTAVGVREINKIINE